MDFHSWENKRVLEQFSSSEAGIGLTEAEKRNRKYGLNEMPSPLRLSKSAICFRQFKSPLVVILLVAGVLASMLGETVDAAVIFAAVLINVAIGFFQENKADNAIHKLRSLVARHALVIRQGREMKVDSRLVAVGDIIEVKAGNRVPADARLIEVASLQVDESGLTGESMPAGKFTAPVPKGAALADRENMVYAGTMAVRGRGRAVVTAIGVKTEIGRIAGMVKETEEEPTPLQRKLTDFAKLLGAMFGAICVLIVVVGLLQGRDMLEMIETGVAVGVASIPEGMSVAVTFILALGIQRILKKRALIRQLMAAETLGSITVICTDKTGTLTEGKMHVAHIVIDGEEPAVSGQSRDRGLGQAASVRLALRAVMLCNDAGVENPQDELKAWRITGSPTDAALLSAAIQSGLDRGILLAEEPRVAELPFDSDSKYMLSLHRHRDGKGVLYEKGAPEILLDKSVSFVHDGQTRSLGPEDRERLIGINAKMTAKGLRVIGLALRELALPEKLPREAAQWQDIDSRLTFIGFIAIKDPLRPEAAQTIRVCRQAGIRPVLITGDHPLTARAIAAEVGLKSKAANVLVGSDLDAVGDDELVRLVKEVDVYARVSPHHKLRIVRALKARGESVAMTGDGINDAPALKAADIGISLGGGTDIAKETADIVLLDDNFATIVSAIKQGRIIFQNIRKVIIFLISDILSEVVLIVGSILLGLPLAILPLQILWLNIVKDGFPHFALAFEKGDGDVMKDKPMAQDEPLLNGQMKTMIFAVGLVRDLLLFAIFFGFLKYAVDIDYIRTLLFAVIGANSLAGIFSFRNFREPIWRLNPFSNPFLVLAVSAAFLLILMPIYLPPLQKILSTVPLAAGDWALVGAVSLLTVMIMEAVKLAYRRRLSIVRT